jgi:glyoxylase-like metal-dependent hydrolase (beta-lactamase superfamily II)
VYKQVADDIYLIEVPLPRSPLKALNSYLIKGQDSFLLIDTGMNHEECMDAIAISLEKLQVDLAKTDIFITHMHADHIGLTARLATPTSRIYLNRPEASRISGDASKRKEYWEKLSAFYHLNGFPEDELQKSADTHPGKLFGLKQRLDFTIVGDNDTIQIGKYSFRCIETPGHSPGHTCLYEETYKILFSGDHILFDITPNNTYWPAMENSLKQYLASLDKVYPLNVELTLPGHRSIMQNHRRRIKELKEHHLHRLTEVLSALQNGSKTAYDIAPLITWDIGFKSWEKFPAQQKWFAFGETMSHLIYLEEAGAVRKISKNGVTLFQLKENASLSSIPLSL